MADKFKVKDLLLQVALKTPEDVVYDRTGKPVSFDDAGGVRVTLTRVPTKAEIEAEAKENPLTEALRRYGKAIGIDAEFVNATLIREIMNDNPIFSELTFQTPPARASYQHLRKKSIADRAPGELSRAGWDFVQKSYPHLAGTHVHIVGQHYRPKLDQETLLGKPGGLAGKRPGHMVLLVAEPDNGHDLNGVMVLVWNQTESQWRHVGYVPREQAAKLRAKWPDDDLSRVVVGHIASVPANADGRRGGRNISVLLSGQTRKYPAYRA